ncbi:hypothetical protein CRUP_023257 [Coryphaenoides rupestris]|nr:hypothetical protein CRUP_023257 [Coryphaenoides rupestris]
MIENQEDDEFIAVRVQDPRTNSKSFTAKTSCVRRRYSEFRVAQEETAEELRTRGHTPYTVTDAILTYASSNQGYAQAQQEDLLKERGSSVVPAPHLPSQTNGGERDHLLTIAEGPPTATAQLIVCRSEDLSLQVLQEENRLEAVIEQHGPAPVPAATFYLESGRDEEPPLACQIQAAVEVHSPTARDAAIAPDWQVEVVEEEEEEEEERWWWWRRCWRTAVS